MILMSKYMFVSTAEIIQATKAQRKNQSAPRVPWCIDKEKKLSTLMNYYFVSSLKSHQHNTWGRN